MWFTLTSQGEMPNASSNIRRATIRRLRRNVARRLGMVGAEDKEMSVSNVEASFALHIRVMLCESIVEASIALHIRVMTWESNVEASFALHDEQFRPRS